MCVQPRPSLIVTAASFLPFSYSKPSVDMFCMTPVLSLVLVSEGSGSLWAAAAVVMIQT